MPRPVFLSALLAALWVQSCNPWSASEARGQSIPNTTGQDKSNRASWPAPIRQVQHLQPASVRQVQNLRPAPQPTRLAGNQYVLGVPSARLQGPPVNMLRSGTPPQPHQVIESPDRRTNSSSPKTHTRVQRHPPHLSRHHPAQPSPAMLPRASQRETWKTPYSYGYFGAGATRHWSLHHGHRDRYTEWRLH